MALGRRFAPPVLGPNAELGIGAIMPGA